MGKITYSAHVDVICGVHILLNIPCDVYFALTDVFTLPSIYPQQLVLELRSGLRDLLSCLPQLHSWHVQWTAHVPASVSSVYV